MKPEEHDDDIAPEVEDGVEFEVETFPVLAGDDESADEQDDTEEEDDTDPSEI